MKAKLPIGYRKLLRIRNRLAKLDAHVFQHSNEAANLWRPYLVDTINLLHAEMRRQVRSN